MVRKKKAIEEEYYIYSIEQEIALGAIGFFIGSFNSSYSGQIYNLPFIFPISFFLALLAVFIAIYLKRFHNILQISIFKRKIENLAINILIVTFLAFLWMGVLGIPFSIYLIDKSKTQPLQYFDCEIVEVSKAKKRSLSSRPELTCRFRDRLNDYSSDHSAINSFEMIDSIYKHQDLQNYRVRIRVRATKFGAYYLDFKEIIKIPSGVNE